MEMALPLQVGIDECRWICSIVAIENEVDGREGPVRSLFTCEYLVGNDPNPEWVECCYCQHLVPRVRD